MNGGWIKLHRRFLEWEWYDDNNIKVVFLHCLFKANYKDKKYRGETIKRGQFITGREQFADEVSLSVQNVRTAFSKLESTGELTIKTTSKGTMVTVCKYDSYQSKDDDDNQHSNQQLTNNQPATNHQLTTTKKEKKVKNGKKDYVQFVDFWNKVNDCNLRITDSKREQIRARLRTYSEEELKTSIRNRSNDEWINGEGIKYKTNWDSFWRNDEKPERYLKEQPQELKPSYYQQL